MSPGTDKYMQGNEGVGLIINERTTVYVREYKLVSQMTIKCYTPVNGDNVRTIYDFELYYETL